VDWFHLAQGLVERSYEHGNEPGASVKDGDFLTR